MSVHQYLMDRRHDRAKCAIDVPGGRWAMGKVIDAVIVELTRALECFMTGA